MHPEFADWYQFLSMQPTEPDLNARWAGVEGFGKKAPIEDLFDAARVFFGRPPRDPDFVDRYRASLKLSSEGMPATKRNAELQVLAGAALVAAFDMPQPRGVAAALTLVCGSFCGCRTAPVADIVRVAREHLAAQSAQIRKPTTSSLAKLTRIEAESAAATDNLRKAMQANGAPSTWADALVAAFEPLQQGLLSLSGWAQDQGRQLTLRIEESEVLWWLFAEHSRDLRIPFDDLKPPAIVLVAAKEMADLTRTLPGPYSSYAFLDRAVRGRAVINDEKPKAKTTITLAAAVAACPTEWRKTAAAARAEIDTLADLSPTCLALEKAVDSEGKKAWQSVFANLTGLNPTHALDPVELANQAYSEWLLVRALRQLKVAK